VVTKLKGELFGRMAPDYLAKFLVEGDLMTTRSYAVLEQQEVMRSGKYPMRMPPQESEAPKIILLDMRTVQEYAKWHVKNAVSFPATNIQKDQVFASLHQHRNKEDKLIVIYMDDERHGTQVAKIIFEKGFDNIYLLTGGISVFGYEHQHLLEGADVPTKSELRAWH
jgi:rhodanese-related sulfurtransferase